LSARDLRTALAIEIDPAAILLVTAMRHAGLVGARRMSVAAVSRSAGKPACRHTLETRSAEAAQKIPKTISSAGTTIMDISWIVGPNADAAAALDCRAAEVRSSDPRTRAG
jgi:hypothetical protein